MNTVTPVGSGRTPQLLLHQQLARQVGLAQAELSRLQQQLATGLRLTRPSDDPGPAQRAMMLRRLIQQQDQFQASIRRALSLTGAADTALSEAVNQVRNIRSLAVSLVGETAGPEQRAAAVSQVGAAIQAMLQLANLSVGGQHLFAGSRVGVAPYQVNAGQVVYRGNERALLALAAPDWTLPLTLAGPDAFGGVSAEVRGQRDLDPVLTAETRLADLYRGAGVSPRTLEISDGTSAVRLDLSSASTIGDVVRLLEQNPPPGRQVTVRIANRGLIVELDADGGGELVIRDVDGGTTARMLGIAQEPGTGSLVRAGDDLDPALTYDTRLEYIGGGRAWTVLQSPGSNSNIIFRAREPGTALNGVRVQYVNDHLLHAGPGIVRGQEFAVWSDTATAARAALAFSGPGNDLVLTAVDPGSLRNQIAIRIQASDLGGDNASVTYDASSRVLTLHIDQFNRTTAGTLVNAINTHGMFTAAPDPSAGEVFDPAAVIAASDAGVVEGNTGNSGGDPGTVFIHVAPGQSRAADVLAALQANPQITERFEVALDEKDTTSVALQGTGTVDPDATAELSDGYGAPLDLQGGIRLQLGDQTAHVPLWDAVTVGDVLARFAATGLPVVAEIGPGSASLNIRNLASGAALFVGENGGRTATDLGVRSVTEETLLAELNGGEGVRTVDGPDLVIVRNDGVELEIDLSGAVTVGDVLDLINQHPLNQDPDQAVTARLAVVGNGIELVDDNPQGESVLTVRRATGSVAAWDLGLVPAGLDQAVPGKGAPPQRASLLVAFPSGQDNAFVVRAPQVGDQYNGIEVRLVHQVATGNQALVQYDPLARRLTIDVDPSATTASTVVDAINASGLFAAELDFSRDPANDGSGLVLDAGTVGFLTGGSPNPSAQPARANLTFPPPFDANTALLVTANQPGTARNGVEIELRDTLSGDVAVAQMIGNRLVIDIDASATTANTLRAAIEAEGTFHAELDRTVDPTNDGTGIVGTTGVIAVTDGGTPEVLTGIDPRPIEGDGVFPALLRLQKALAGGDEGAIQRAIGDLEAAEERLMEARAQVATHAQTLETLSRRGEDDLVYYQTALSEAQDTDFTETVSRLLALQATLEATLRMTARAFQLSLFQFL